MPGLFKSRNHAKHRAPLASFTSFTGEETRPQSRCNGLCAPAALGPRETGREPGSPAFAGFLLGVEHRRALWNNGLSERVILWRGGCDERNNRDLWHRCLTLAGGSVEAFWEK